MLNTFFQNSSIRQDSRCSPYNSKRFVPVLHQDSVLYLYDRSFWKIQVHSLSWQFVDRLVFHMDTLNLSLYASNCNVVWKHSVSNQIVPDLLCSIVEHIHEGTWQRNKRSICRTLIVVMMLLPISASSHALTWHVTLPLLYHVECSSVIGPMSLKRLGIKSHDHCYFIHNKIYTLWEIPVLWKPQSLPHMDLEH